MRRLIIRTHSTLYIFGTLITSTLVLSVSVPSSTSICPISSTNYLTYQSPQQCLANPAPLLVTDDQGFARTSILPSGQSSLVSIPVTSQIPSTSTVLVIPQPGIPTTTTGVHSVPATVVVPVNSIDEEDSALGSNNFLSFEEWKQQNLRKAGQSEHVGRAGQNEIDGKRSKSVQHNLDTLGDDAEIDIDFSGFTSGTPEQSSQDQGHLEDSDAVEEKPRRRGRSKDAGTTCKERFNYASFDCAANVLKTNKEAKNPNTILTEHKDSYMLNQCVAKDKFVILELCNDISIDTIVLANFEFFSSTFRTFEVSVSDRYPVKAEKWKKIGTYEAHNSREIQAFLVENPIIWARYVKIDFLTHYGREYYCPVSLVRVHGTTMLEEYKRDLELASEGEDDEDEVMTTASVVRSSELALTGDQSSFAANGSNPTPGLAQTKGFDQESLPAQDVNVYEDPSLSHAQSSPPSVTAYEAIASVIGLDGTCKMTDSPLPQLTTDSSATFSSALSMTSHTSPVSATIGEDPKVVDATIDTTSTSGSAVVPINTTSNSPHAQSQHFTTSKSSKPGPAVPSSQSGPAMQDSFFKSVQKRLAQLETNSSLSLQYIEDQSRALREAFRKVEHRQLSRTANFLEELNRTVLSEMKELRMQSDQLWQSTIVELAMQRDRHEKDNAALNARLSILADEVIFQRRIGILQMLLILVCLLLVLFSRGVINNYLELPLLSNALSKSNTRRWLNLSNAASPEAAPQMRRQSSAHQLGAARMFVKSHRPHNSYDSNMSDVHADTEIKMTETNLGGPITPVSNEDSSDVEVFVHEDDSTIVGSRTDADMFSELDAKDEEAHRPSSSPPVMEINDHAMVDAFRKNKLGDTTSIQDERL